MAGRLHRRRRNRVLAQELIVPTVTPAARRQLGADFAQIPAGSFRMGTSDTRFPGDAEGPIREVAVDAFELSRHPVTIAQFEAFISATGYVTDAERFGWSFVFHHFVSGTTKTSVRQAVKGSEWWWQVHGTTWRCPDGPDSSVDGRSSHPVTHVSWRDAVAYCKWAAGTSSDRGGVGVCGARRLGSGQIRLG